MPAPSLPHQARRVGRRTVVRFTGISSLCDLQGKGHMRTVVLLLISNTFMTFAWYGHLKFRKAPIVAAIFGSWLIALGEYCFQVPANRLGYGEFTAYQLKIIQEVITLSVFIVFAYAYLDEPLKWNYAAAFAFLGGAVVCAFWGR